MQREKRGPVELEGWQEEAGVHRNRRREPTDVRSSDEQLRGLAAVQRGEKREK
jgi:hypothetical protein